MTTRRRDDGPRAAAVVLGALAQIVGSPLGTAIAGRSVGEVSDGNRSLITPAGHAFSIWGVIFAGALAWAVYQALPGQRVRPVHRRTGWPLAAAFTGNAVWEVAFPLVGDTAAVVPAVLLFLIVAATALAWARLQALVPEGWARLLPAAVTGLLLGWVTVAAVVENLHGFGTHGVASHANRDVMPFPHLHSADLTSLARRQSWHMHVLAHAIQPSARRALDGVPWGQWGRWVSPPGTVTPVRQAWVRSAEHPGRRPRGSRTGVPSTWGVGAAR